MRRVMVRYNGQARPGRGANERWCAMSYYDERSTRPEVSANATFRLDDGAPLRARRFGLGSRPRTATNPCRGLGRAFCKRFTETIGERSDERR